MRAIHVLAVAAALALGAVLAAPAQAQGLVEATPPADSAGPAQPPTYEDLKAEVATGQPPKGGSLWVFDAWPQEWRTPLNSKRTTTQQQINPNH